MNAFLFKPSNELITKFRIDIYTHYELCLNIYKLGAIIDNQLISI